MRIFSLPSVLRSWLFSVSLATLACWCAATPAAAAAIGNVDNIAKGQIAGWALDLAATSATSNVSIYLDGPNGVGKQLGSISTNGSRIDINARYKTTGSHGFSWSIPTQYKQARHIWFVYATGVDGSATLLGNAPVVYPPIAANSIGTPEMVVDYQTEKCEFFDIPDHPARAYRTADGNVTLIASHLDARRAVGPTLNSVKHQCAVIHKSSRDSTFQNFRYFQWLQGPYTFDGKTIYEIMHNEWYGNIVKPSCHGDMIDSWVSAMTLAVSRDGGASFVSPLDYIVRNPTTPWSNSFPCTPSAPTRYGDLGGSNIIKKGSYYYKFFIYETEPNITPAQSRQCVMRSDDLSNASSWSVWNGRGWTKSKTDPCAPVPVLQNARSVTYNVALHMYLAVQWFPPRGFAFNVSWDLMNWSAPTMISTPGLDGATTAYPSLLDPIDTSLNFERSGLRPYLYYTQQHPGTFGDLMRIPLRFSVESGE